MYPNIMYIDKRLSIYLSNLEIDYLKAASYKKS